jgi:hypothetical protein
MVDWIQSQTTPVIVLCTLAFCYALAVIAFALATTLSRRPVGEELKTISPVTLTPLAVILGLLIAFLASRVWDNATRAGEHVGQEASALSELVLLADALPPQVRTNLRDAVKRHVAFVVEQDWPAMEKLHATLRSESGALKAALAELLAFTPTQVNQQLAQERAARAIELAYEARRKRIQLSQSEIGRLQWIVIVVLATSVLITTALIHIGKPVAMATTLFIFSTSIAACLILLGVYDRPFAGGGVTMQPTAFREIRVD